MHRLGLFLFIISIIILVVKFGVIVHDQIGMLQMLQEVGNWNKHWITLYFNTYWLFIEPILILISLTGFLLRRRLGFQLSLIFVYFILAYAMLHYLTPIDKHDNFHIGIVTLPILVGVLINTPATTRIFSDDLTQKLRLRYNSVAFLTGLALNGILLIITA